MSSQERKNGHQNRIREEITEYLSAYFEESGEQRPEGIETYILEQTSVVLERMYAEDKDPRPENEDPDTIEGDYYRESICEYGTVFLDYSLDE